MREIRSRLVGSFPQRQRRAPARLRPPALWSLAKPLEQNATSIRDGSAPRIPAATLSESGRHPTKYRTRFADNG